MDKNNQTSVEDAPKANPPETVTEKTVEQQGDNAKDPIDYEKKFSMSTTENQRIMAENAAKDAEIERLRKLAEQAPATGNDPENPYPGFENLNEEEQKNLLDYTRSIENRVRDGILKDPAISFAKHSYNERVWNDAFEKATTDFPELRESREEFKTKYFKPDNVPSNISDLMKDLAKIHLFDKAKDIGAKEAAEQANRLDTERSKGGDKAPSTTRTLEDWTQMAQSNPAEFAKKSKEFNADMESGKLK